MRTWSYTYRTSDGLKHEAEMSAPSKDEVYASLRKQGIKAIKVVERIQPVIVRGVRKRIVFAILVVVCACASLVAYRFGRGDSEEKSSTDGGYGAADGIWDESFARPRPRRQLGVKVAELKLAEIFAHPAECYLANFAQPGSAVADLDLDDEIIEDFLDAIDDPIVVSDDDDPVIAELKRIVAGLKEDVRLHLKTGKGIREIAAWLVHRQNMEKSYRDEIIRRAKETRQNLDEINATLDSIGFERVSEGAKNK